MSLLYMFHRQKSRCLCIYIYYYIMLRQSIYYTHVMHVIACSSTYIVPCCPNVPIADLPMFQSLLTFG